jgi:hypothetical protein
MQEKNLEKLPRTLLTLRKREAKLRTLLALNAAESRLIKAADLIRGARIQVLRSRIGELPFADAPERRRRVAKIDAQIEALRATTLDTILAEFRMA